MLHRCCLLLYARPSMFPSGPFIFFTFLPVLYEMLSNEALCWKDTYTPEIFIWSYLQAP